MKTEKKHVPVIMQMEAAESGAASLCMILAYHGKYIDLDVMRTKCHATRDGVKISDIIETAELYELSAAELRSDQVPSSELPVIALWESRHYVVVEEADAKCVTLCDPAVGRRKISRQEFDAGYSGIILTFAPTEKFERSGDSLEISLVKYYADMMKEEPKPFIYMALVSFMLGLIGLVVPSMSSTFIDVYMPSIGYSSAESYFIVFAAMLAVHFCLLLARKQSTMHFRRYRVADTNGNLMKKIFRLPSSYFSSRNHYNLLYQFKAIDILEDFATSSLIYNLLKIIFSFFYFLMLLRYSLFIGTVVVITMFAIFAFVGMMMGEAANYAMGISSNKSAFFEHIGQSIKLFDTIKSTATENIIADNAMNAYVRYANSTRETYKLEVIMNTICSATPVLMQTITVFLGCSMAMCGKMSIGNIMACQSLVLSIASPLGFAISSFSSMQAMTSTIRYTKDIMSGADDPMLVRTGDKKGPFESVELKNVTFGYGSAPVLKNISLKINAGKSIAIVGASGSGKTTLLRMIEGLYIPQQGAVLFNGVPIAQTERSALAASISVISQEPSLFNGTVKDNITLFDNTATLEEVQAAAEAACVLDVIAAKPKGFGEQIDTSFNSFSGGEVQRLMIARALVRRPHIIIMDEATSALDTLVEEQVMNNIADTGTTRIIVSHRLSAIRDADEIIVLEHGVIAERGTHNQLMSLENSIYRKLVMSDKVL